MIKEYVISMLKALCTVFIVIATAFAAVIGIPYVIFKGLSNGEYYEEWVEMLFSPMYRFFKK